MKGINMSDINEIQCSIDVFNSFNSKIHGLTDILEQDVDRCLVYLENYPDSVLFKSVIDIERNINEINEITSDIVNKIINSLYHDLDLITDEEMGRHDDIN